MNSTYKLLVIYQFFCCYTYPIFSQERLDEKIQNYKSRLEELYNQGERLDSVLYLLNEVERLSIAENRIDDYVYSLLAGANISNMLNDLEAKNCYVKRSYTEGLNLIPSNHIYVPSIYSNYSDYYSSIGDYLEADLLLDAAFSRLKTLPSGSFRHKNTISILLNQGISKGNLGDFNASTNLYNQVLKLCSDSLDQDLEYKRKYSSALYNLGVDNFFKKNYSASIFYLKQNLKFISSLPSALSEVSNRTYISLANSYLAIDSSQQALFSLSKVIKEEDSSYVSNFHNVKARCLTDLNKYKAAEEEIDTAIEITREEHPNRKKDPLLGYYYKTKAEIFFVRGDMRNALKNYTNAIIHFENLKSHKNNRIRIIDDYVFEILLKISKIYLKFHTFYNTEDWLYKAYQNSQRLILLIDQFREQLQTLDAQLFISNELMPAFEQAINISLKIYKVEGKPKYLEEAFNLAEKSKAVLLSNALNDTYAKYSGGVPDSLLAQERELKANISFFKNLIFKEGNKKGNIDSLKIDRWERKLFDLERDKERFGKMFAQQYPDYYSLKQDERISIKDIQRNLDRNTLLLEFFAGDSALYIFSLDKYKLDYKKISNPHEVYDQIEKLSRDFRNKADSSLSLNKFQKTASTLFDVLIGRQLLSYKKLIFIPDGQLGKIPFEFLITDDTTATSFSNLPYLGNVYDIQYAYSAKLLYQDPLKRNRHANHKLWAGFAPHFEGEKRLVFNGQEVEGINQLMQGDIFLNEKANLPQAKQIIDQYKILHFATHGYSQMERPMYSRIEFTYQDSLEDGIFYAHDLMNHKINADLVVLSACETGEGKVAKGEGIMSFAWAFRYAGAPSILMSLWKAESSVSQRIMLSFYYYLKEGKTKTEALRLAKQDYIQNPIPGREHPKYWANFILIGDDAPIFMDPKLKWIALAGLVLFMVLVIMAIYQRRKFIPAQA